MRFPFRSRSGSLVPKLVGYFMDMYDAERVLTRFAATFDDLTTPTVVSLTSVGVYEGLNYTGICMHFIPQ